MGCLNRVVLFALIMALAQLAGAAEPARQSKSASIDTAAGWPSVRGVTFDAHSSETNIAEAWPEAGPPVLWVREIGQGYSAFVAGGQRVFTQAQSLAGQFVLCLDADTGETIWEHRYDLPYESIGVYPGPRSTPTLAEDKVVFTAPDGMVRCLDVSNGRERWTVSLDERYGLLGTEFGYSCGPTIVGKLVLLPAGGPGASIVALHLDDGREVWKSGNDAASYTPILPIVRNGRTCAVGFLRNALVICDLQTGRQLARLDLSNGYDEHSAWPLYQEPWLWIGEPFRAGSTLLKIPDCSSDPNEAGPVPTIETVWKSKLMSNDVLSSVLVDGHVYGFDIMDAQSKTQRPSRGYFSCQEFLTGKITWAVGSEHPRRDWKTRAADDSFIGQAGIVVADGKLIMLNEIGELILARINAERFEQLARATVLGGELVWTPPILHRGRIYVRNQSRAVCIYIGKPEELNESSQPLLSIADVPQTEYVDWTGMLLAIEPEYAFDIPSDEWLWNWFVVSISMLLGGHILGWLLTFRSRGIAAAQRRLLISRWTAFLGGCAGTTVLGHVAGEFIFTWPLALFVVSDVAISNSRSRGGAVSSRQRFREGLSLVLLAVTNLAFFWLCRRLSLVFEWAFLAGPLASLPLQALVARWRRRLGILAPLVTILLECLAFTAFFGLSVAILKWKYGG